MNSAILTILMLVVSNVFMTLAWYGHLRLGELGITKNWPLYAVILFSWESPLPSMRFRCLPTASAMPEMADRSRWFS